jgi:hypothetical protein
LVEPNFVVFRARLASSISSDVPGYQPSSTLFEPGVKRWVMNSTVRSGEGTSSSAAAAASANSASYPSRQPSCGMTGATVSPTG